MKRPPTSAFTLIEIVTAISVILILTGLVLSTASFVTNSANRTRAKDELNVLEMCLKNYYADSSRYPEPAGDDPHLLPKVHFLPSEARYPMASLLLYRELTGDRHGATPNSEPDGVLDEGAKSYWDPRIQHMIKVQRDPNGRVASVLYIQDPWGDAYGYSIAGPKNGGFNTSSPDLWSTANTHPATPPTADSEKAKLHAKWIKNW